MNTYIICYWQTRTSPSSTFYSGTRKVEAADEEEEEQRCKQSIGRDFQDCGGSSHIRVTKVELSVLFKECEY